MKLQIVWEKDGKIYSEVLKTRSINKDEKEHFIKKCQLNMKI